MFRLATPPPITINMPDTAGDYTAAKFGLLGALLGALVGLVGVFVQQNRAAVYERRREIRKLHDEFSEALFELNKADEDLDYAWSILEVARSDLKDEPQESSTKAVFDAEQAYAVAREKFQNARANASRIGWRFAVFVPPLLHDMVLSAPHQVEDHDVLVPLIAIGVAGHVNPFFFSRITERYRFRRDTRLLEVKPILGGHRKHY